MFTESHSDVSLSNIIPVASEYIYPDILKHQKTPELSHFSLLHHNIRSLKQHHNTFLDYLSYQNIIIDCIVLTETFLNEHNNGLYPIPGYTETHAFRSNKRGGGVSIYLKNGIYTSHEVIISTVNSHIEALATSVQIKSNKIIVMGVYRPPNSSKTEFINALKDIIKTHFLNSKVIIAGDFNIDLSNENITNQANSLSNLMLSNGFVNYITLPTRPNNVENRCPSLIDHIWGKLNWNVNTFVIKSDMSDHFPCLAKFAINKTQNFTTIKYRLDGEHQRLKYINKMNEIDFSFTYSENTGINEKFNSFVNILNKYYDESFPIKTKKLGAKRIQNPWLTPALLNSINQKHKLYRNFKNKIIPFQVYNTYDKQLKAVLRKAKRKHYSNKFQDCNKDSKATWGLINKLINNNKKKLSMYKRTEFKQSVNNQPK